MEAEERAQALAAVLGCDDASAEALAGAMALRSYPSKAILIHQGDVNGQLWLILAGTVQLQTLSIEGTATVISSFGPGEMVGAFPDEDENAFDARAFGRVTALQINARELQRLLEQWPDLGGGLAEIFAGQLDIVLDRLSARVTLSAYGRVYREVLRQAGKDEAITPAPVVSALGLSAQTTRETASRAISDIEQRGIIRRSEGKLVIVSRRLLEAEVI